MHRPQIRNPEIHENHGNHENHGIHGEARFVKCQPEHAQKTLMHEFHVFHAARL